MDWKRYEKWLIVYLKGFAMGCADAVPGVSGGTIALIVGIYERLITAITSIDIEKIVAVMKCVTPSMFPEAKEAFLDMDGPFLLVLGLGIITAVVSILRIIYYLLSNHPVPTYGFFFGLIAVSAVILYREVDLSTSGRKAAALAGFLTAFITSGYATAALGHELPVIFLAGMVAVSAMVLPGISGSLILIILGQYEYMSGALSEFTDAIVSGLVSGNTVPVIETGPPVVVFITGAVVGLFTVAHIVRRALDTYRYATIAFLVSLVAGALRAPVEEVNRTLVEQGATWASVLPEFTIAALAGGLMIYLIDRKAGVIEY